MEDLLQSQIQESCRLALPNGLKELMHDISREVLRAQPPDMLKFITEYLSTLLITRENLHIAAKVCGAVYDCQCRPELEDELRYIGLDDQNASDAAKIIEKFLGMGEVNEGNLFLKLVRKTSIDESQLPAVLTAIRNAFLRHQTNHTKFYESSSDSDEDEVARAARHTLKLYRKTEPTFETYNCMAMRIQASYRAYKIRRESGAIRSTKSDQLSKTPSKSESFKITNEVTAIDHLGTANKTENEKAKVTFGALDHVKERTASDLTVPCDDEDVVNFEAGPSKPVSGITVHLSSMSLADSYLSLPQYKPYSAHDLEDYVGHENTPEKKWAHLDYAREKPPVEEMFINDMTKENEQKDEKIVFYESMNEENSIEEMVESYEEVAENILEYIEEDAVVVDIVKLSEGIVGETIIRGKDLAVKYNAENMSNENISKQNISDENTKEKYTVNENSDNVTAENDDKVEENIVGGDTVEEQPEVDILEDIPEAIDLPADKRNHTTGWRMLEKDEEADTILKDLLGNDPY